MKKVLRPVLTLAATLCLVAGALATPAMASSGQALAQTHGGRSAGDYLALGDSVTFGYNPLLAPGAPSRYVGYPELAAPVLGLRLTNLACPGETSGSYLTGTLPDNGCQAFRAVAALHTSYPGSQAAAAAAFLAGHRDTRLVTVMIGANDLFLCQKTTADGCTSPAELSATLAGVAAHLQTSLDAIRSLYHGRLVLVAYYSTDYSNAFTTGAVQALDAVLAAQAATHGAQVADGFTAFEQIAAKDAGSTCAAHLLIALPTGGCDVHPTQFGADVLAHTVVATVRQRAA